MPSPELAREAERLMVICNACRYCEGYCAVFPAMMQRKSFAPQELAYLANLCHDCRGCYYACQYAPPHEFDVNVPRVFAKLRVQTYEDYAWPRFLGRLFHRNGTTTAVLSAFAFALVMLLANSLRSPELMFGTHLGPGAFYSVIPHLAMVLPAGTVFAFAILAMSIGALRFRRDNARPEDTERGAGWKALRDALQLRYLAGGGEGCNYPRARFSHARRWLHQLVMYGFLLCLAATSVATVYEYGFGWLAPYPLWSLPVLLGTTGGIALCVGCAGLLWLKTGSDAAPEDPDQAGMDVGLLVLLLLTSATGLALLALRAPPAMGQLLAVHLGVVLALFLALPYSKFVHWTYRLAALARFAAERSRR